MKLNDSFRAGLRIWYFGWRVQKEWNNLCRKVSGWWYG